MDYSGKIHIRKSCNSNGIVKLCWGPQWKSIFSDRVVLWTSLLSLSNTQWRYRGSNWVNGNTRVLKILRSRVQLWGTIDNPTSRKRCSDEDPVEMLTGLFMDLLEWLVAVNKTKTRGNREGVKGSLCSYMSGNQDLHLLSNYAPSYIPSCNIINWERERH